MPSPAAKDPARNTQRPRDGFSTFVERSRERPLVGFAAAVITTVIALGLTSIFQGELQRVIFVLFFVSVSLTAWIGGLGPSVLATILAVVGVDYFFISPTRSLRIGHRDDIAPLLAFAAVSIFISWLAESQRKIARTAAVQARQLLEKNTELEVQMEESQALQEEVEQTSEALAATNDELMRSREFLEQAQRSAMLGSWEWDMKANTIDWSDQMFRVYGIEPGSTAVSFETFSGFIHPDDRETVHLAVDEARRTRQPFAFDHRVIWPDGAVRWVHGRGQVIFDANGEPVRMVGSGQDITERKRALEAQRLLSEASETLASSLDYKQTLVAVADLAVHDLADWCSIAIGDETGHYSNLAVAHRDPQRVKWAEEYNRLNPPRFDTPTGVPNVLRTGKSEFYPEITRELLEASAQSAEELRVIDELQMHSAMVVPMVARGRTIGAISFIGAESRRRFTDADLWLAERLANRAAIAIDNARLFEEARAARADAEAANQAKAHFLASMSHELRTPLNAIAGYAELLELEVLGPVTDKQRDAVARLQRSRQHLTTLVEQVLSFARIEAGKIDFQLTHVPLNEALTTVADLIAPQAERKNLRYRFDGCDDSVGVRADPERLDQIILNLLANAVKFTPTGGSISVSVDCGAESVAISVSDTGPGIPLEKQQLIFEPFVQLTQSPETLASGVGLGLPISRDLARAMDGEITVTSRLGSGSVFTLTIPRSTSSEAALPVPADTNRTATI